MPRGIPNKPATKTATKAKAARAAAKPATAPKRATTSRAMAGNKPGSTSRKVAPAIVEKRTRSKALSAAGTKAKKRA
jgi:hypothetical protein